MGENDGQSAPLSFRGSPMEVGYALGLTFRESLGKNSRSYLDAATQAGVLDVAKMRRESMSWFQTVPPHFRQEMEGVSNGADVPLRELIENLYGSAYSIQACTSVISSVNGRTWIAHNNDWYDFGSHRWTSAVVRAIDGKIPHLTFGIQGDVCTVVGVNKERLWLHMNGFFSTDSHRPDAPVMPYVFVIREALEICHTIDELEAFLEAWDRDNGMAIYAVDGKTEAAALFECGLSTYIRRDPVASKTLVSSSRDLSIREVDHRQTRPLNAQVFGSNSRERIDRLHALLTTTRMKELPADLIGILADPIVENLEGTIYSNVACPGQGLVWFSGGSLPAASTGTWRQIDWPWS